MLINLAGGGGKLPVLPGGGGGTAGEDGLSVNYGNKL